MRLGESYHRICVLLCLGVFLLQSCSGPDCGAHAETQYNFKQDDTLNIPYSGYDTLYFVNSVRDTFMAIGQGKQKSSTTVPTTGDPDCGYNTDTYHSYGINYFDRSFRYTFGQRKIRSSNEIQLRVNNVGCSFNWDYTVWKYDSLVVNDKKYHRVFELEVKSDNGVYYPETYVFHYCREYGLIQFSGSTNGVLWSRIDK